MFIQLIRQLKDLQIISMLILKIHLLRLRTIQELNLKNLQRVRQVFLQRYGEGDCFVAERRGGYFVVQGTPGLAFGWEVKAKQKDFDQLRLERADEPFTVPEQRYGAEAAQYITELKNGRVSA